MVARLYSSIFWWLFLYSLITMILQLNCFWIPWLAKFSSLSHFFQKRKYNDSIINIFFSVTRNTFRVWLFCLVIFIVSLLNNKITFASLSIHGCIRENRCVYVCLCVCMYTSVCLYMCVCIVLCECREQPIKLAVN